MYFWSQKSAVGQALPQAAVLHGSAWAISSPPHFNTWLPYPSREGRRQMQELHREVLLLEPGRDTGFLSSISLASVGHITLPSHQWLGNVLFGDPRRQGAEWPQQALVVSAGDLEVILDTSFQLLDPIHLLIYLRFLVKLLCCALVLGTFWLCDLLNSFPCSRVFHLIGPHGTRVWYQLWHFIACGDHSSVLIKLLPWFWVRFGFYLFLFFSFILQASWKFCEPVNNLLKNSL